MKRMAEAGMTQGGDGGDMRDLALRVGRLEQDVGEIKSDLKTVLADLTSLRTDLAYLRGRVEMLPTLIQLLGFTVAVFVAAGVTRLFIK